jgi:hypothetical protein
MVVIWSHLALLPDILEEWHVANIYKTKLISCATNQKHIIYGNSIVMMVSFITKRKQKLTGTNKEIAKIPKTINEITNFVER